MYVEVLKLLFGQCLYCRYVVDNYVSLNRASQMWGFIVILLPLLLLVFLAFLPFGRCAIRSLVISSLVISSLLSLQKLSLSSLQNLVVIIVGIRCAKKMEVSPMIALAIKVTDFEPERWPQRLTESHPAVPNLIFLSSSLPLLSRPLLPPLPRTLAPRAS